MTETMLVPCRPRRSWRPQPRRTFSFAVLCAKSAMSVDQVTTALGISGDSRRRFEVNGLDVWQADRYACRLGVHPSTVWADWLQVDDREVAA